MEILSISKIVVPILSLAYFGRKNYIYLIKKNPKGRNTIIDISYNFINFMGFLVTIIVIIETFFVGLPLDYFYTVCVTIFLYLISELIDTYKKTKVNNNAYIYIFYLIFILLIWTWLITAD